ncbi:chemotaxis protein CheC [bacterium]|jgi:chemotaxis protein CheC|nr:chemotaxis protein CheC [bacterium]MBT4122272.1 chemotaxis protein CheC [bacterium]MBT4335007.1 chemotaxis protein CheC [bacterium]MBT4495450.1 chemotaxis protein CheC [bacterium]MBT4763926.1 chemotaxis protein CheC [bacterium]
MAKKITSFEIDQLKEITNIGAGNASTALSHMLGKKVQMTVPESYVGKIEEVQRNFGEASDKVLALFLKMHGDLEGAMAMIFKPEDALSFMEILTKKKKKSLDEMDELDESSILEVGNILLGASITALAKFLDLNITHTIPDMTVNMLGAIMDTVLLEIGSDSEEILAFKVNLHFSDDNIGGDIYYIFDPAASGIILKATKEKVK